MRRRFLVALTTIVLWTLGYLAYDFSGSVRATAPTGLHVRQDAGDNSTDDSGED